MFNRREFLSLPAAAAVSAATEDGTALRSRSLFDAGWLFHRGEASGGQDPGFDDSAWSGVTLPHDWSIAGPFDEKAPGRAANGFAPGGIGWYRKRFQVPNGRGRRVILEFDGVYQESDVWINGVHLGHRPYGYSSFHYEVTRYLRSGDNVLGVRVDNSLQPNCRWYTGSGIYRHVWLTRTAPVHIAQWGTYITTPKVTERSAVVVVRTTIRNDSGAGVACSLETRVGGSHGVERVDVTLPAGESREVKQEFTVADPRWWSPETPALYEAASKVIVAGQTVDTYTTPFGIREVRFDAARGLLVNGRSVKMRGVCLHHDAGCLGAAVPDAALERRLRVLKSIGCNAIRTSHNPPAPELLDMADRMGFLVIDEAFDKWGGYTNPGFAAWWERDLRGILQRDRNHPSVVLWSVGNETGRPGTAQVNDTLQKLVDFVHREETSRLVTCALVPVSGPGSVEEKARAIASSATLMDVASLNYSEQWYEHVHKLLPEKVIIGAESYPYYRGDGATHKAHLEVNPWYDVARHSYVAGQFLWTGIDYLGESSGWPSRGWPTAPIDTCGFLKPGAYLHKSFWRADEPLVRIAVLHDGLDTDRGKLHWGYPKMAEHWNWPRLNKDVVRVATVTNCETVELLVNGTSFGVRRAADYTNSTVLWTVPYEAGRVEAVGRNRDGVMARHEIRTSGAPAGIKLAGDRDKMRSGGQDLVHVEVSLVDAAGIPVRDVDVPVTLALSGPATLAGVDNGDLRSDESYQGPVRTTYLGRALAIVRAGFTPGIVTLTASAPAVKGARITVHVV